MFELLLAVVDRGTLVSVNAPQPSCHALFTSENAPESSCSIQNGAANDQQMSAIITFTLSDSEGPATPL